MQCRFCRAEIPENSTMCPMCQASFLEETSDVAAGEQPALSDAMESAVTTPQADLVQPAEANNTYAAYGIASSATTTPDAYVTAEAADTATVAATTPDAHTTTEAAGVTVVEPTIPDAYVTPGLTLTPVPTSRLTPTPQVSQGYSQHVPPMYSQPVQPPQSHSATPPLHQGYYQGQYQSAATQQFSYDRQMGNPGQSMGVASLILGICSIIIPYIGLVCGLVGIPLAAISMRKSKQVRMPASMSVAGLVTSIIGVGIWLLVLILAAVYATTYTRGMYW